MKLTYQNKQLLFSQLIRITITIIILFFLKIPFFLKILLIMFTDTFDCAVPHFLFREWSNCKKEFYQYSDKLTDIICYSILLFYTLKNSEISIPYKKLIMFLFIYRLIGTALFFINNNRKFLFYFPNFYLEITLGLALINYFPILNKFKSIIIALIIIYKLFQEYFLHVDRKIYNKIGNSIKLYIHKNKNFKKDIQNNKISK